MLEGETNVWTDIHGPIRRFIRNRVGDEHVADDLAQEVMLKAQTHLRNAPAEDRLAAWLFQIARNTVIDYYRSPRSRGPVTLDQVEEPTSPSAAAEADVTTELAACLRPMVQRLPQPYREAVQLTEFEGLTQQAVAERLGISLSGAKSRVQRGREKLKALLLDCCKIDVGRGGLVVDCERTERSVRYCGGADKP